MSDKKKTSTAATAVDSKTSALMRRMGSPTGRWNPLPPEQHLFPLLRQDVVLNRTETLLLSWVQLKTVDRYKGEDHIQERTEQAHDSRGDLTLTPASDDLHIDLSNLLKASDVLEDYGLIRRDKKGVLWLCADGLKPTGRKEGETQNPIGLYKLVPEYLHAHIKGLSENDRREFFQGWLAADEWEEDAFAQAKIAIYERKIERRKELCKSIGAELKTGGGRGHKKGEPEPEAKPQIVQLKFVLDPDADQFVQTSWREYEQTSEAGSYEAESDFVPGDATFYKLSVEASERGELATSVPDGERCKPASTPAEAAAPAEADPQIGQEIDELIGYRIAAAGLHSLGGKLLDPATVRNIRTHLLRLPGPVERRQILALLEDKCRHLARHPEAAEEKTWGWVVGMVKGEVKRMLDEDDEPNLKAGIRDAAKSKGMP